MSSRVTGGTGEGGRALSLTLDAFVNMGNRLVLTLNDGWTTVTQYVSSAVTCDVEPTSRDVTLGVWLRDGTFSRDRRGTVKGLSWGQDETAETLRRIMSFISSVTDNVDADVMRLLMRDVEKCREMLAEVLLGEYEFDSGEKEERLGEIDRVYRLIEAADRRRDEIVLCLMGLPGIGKTQAIERFARDHGRNVVHIIASQIMPNEVSGMTMPDPETHTMQVFDHARLGHLRDGDIVFFDELLKGQQQVLNACLTLIQERRLMSGERLPDVLIVAATNPLASAKQLPVEIRQRFMFVSVEWDEDEWKSYMSEAYGIVPVISMLSNIENELDRISRGVDKWNVLTPRSATKLLLWADSVRDDDKSYELVLDEIKDMYGANVRDDVKASIARSHSSEMEFLSSMEDILSTSNVTDERVNGIVSTMRKSGHVSSTDMSELIDALKSLPEWEEVSKALSETEVPTSADGDGAGDGDDDISY